MVGMVHSVESFGSADGPGVRYIVFLQGCPMRCRYCHNPDTWKTEGGEAKTAAELLDQAMRYRSYWGTDGGITVSGGEALMQLDFLVELFTLAHERGINTCLDTSLAPFSPDDPAWMAKFDQLIDVCDLMMVDIKHIDAAEHKKLTGRDNANILAGLTYLSDHGQAMWIRQVLVPGITDDDTFLRRTREFIASLKTVQRIEVLPYHTLGIFKWDELGIPYSLRDTNPPSQERVDNALAILRGEK